MKLMVYTIYDRIAEECGPLFTAKNDGIALRVFNNAIEKVMTPQEELQLFQIATITDHDCQVTPLWPTRWVTQGGAVDE